MLQKRKRMDLSIEDCFLLMIIASKKIITCDQHYRWLFYSIWHSHIISWASTMILLKNCCHHSQNPTDFTKNFNSLQNAIKLYELANQLHVNYTEQQSFHTYNNTMEDDDNDHDDHYSRTVVTLRLTMIVSNNIGQIHRVAGNSKKYTMNLQHL